LAAIGGVWQGGDAARSAGERKRAKAGAKLAKSSQIQQNPAKSSQSQPKKIKGKGLDFLGFSFPNRAFSKAYGESSRFFSLLATVPSRSPMPVATIAASFPSKAGSITWISKIRKENPQNRADRDGEPSRMWRTEEAGRGSRRRARSRAPAVASGRPG
jgi:hypothetical protein